MWRVVRCLGARLERTARARVTYSGGIMFHAQGAFFLSLYLSIYRSLFRSLVTFLEKSVSTCDAVSSLWLSIFFFLFLVKHVVYLEFKGGSGPFFPPFPLANYRPREKREPRSCQKAAAPPTRQLFQRDTRRPGVSFSFFVNQQFGAQKLHRRFSRRASVPKILEERDKALTSVATRATMISIVRCHSSMFDCVQGAEDDSSFSTPTP